MKKRTCGSSKIILVVDEENLSDDKEIAETFNNYFNNVVAPEFTMSFWAPEWCFWWKWSY